MKKLTSILCVVFALAVSVALLAQEKPAKDGGSHLGTWQLASVKYGDSKEFSDYPKARRRLKMITATHFNWVDYDVKTGTVASSAGGRYNLKDEAYVETIDFIGEGMETYLGKKQVFNIKIDGDKLTQAGQLSDGTKIEEVWKRVR